MMIMTLDGLLLYSPQLDYLALENVTLTQDANRFATMTFTIYPDHPSYSKIIKRRSMIRIYEDGVLKIIMRPVKARLNFKRGVTYTCEEWAAVLNDIIRRPSYFSGTPAAYLADVISGFNARYTNSQPEPVAPAAYLDISVPLYRTTPIMTGSSVKKCQTNLVMLGYDLPKYGIDGKYCDETANAVRRFRRDHGLSSDYVFDQDALDVMTALFTVDTPSQQAAAVASAGTVAGISTDTAAFINDDYVGCWDLLQEHLVEVYGGYLIPRYTTNGFSIDYLTEENLPLSTQKILFGENLENLFVDTDATDTFSVLIPLGADVRRTGTLHDGQAKQTPLTIEGVNSGHDFLEDADGIVLYGRREVTYRWDDVTDAATLKTLGQQFLAENAVRLADTVSLDAIDMKNAGVNVDSLEWMTRVQAESELHSVAETYALTKKTTSISSPKATKIRLGTTKKSLTDRIAGNAARATAAYQQLNGRVFNVENPDENQSE